MKDLKYLIFIFSLILTDQVTKFYFFSRGDFISNTGSLFGFFAGRNNLFILISFIAIGILFYFYEKEEDIRLGLSFLIAGTVGNLVDRIMRGYVVDFIDLPYWPVFNFADMFITIGVGYLFYLYFFYSR